MFSEFPLLNVCFNYIISHVKVKVTLIAFTPYLARYLQYTDIKTGEIQRVVVPYV